MSYMLGMAPRTDIPIILLAAGQSSRMRGRDKLLELVNGLPLVRRQAQAARAATSGPVIITLPPAPHPRYQALAGCDAVLQPVERAHEGLSESLKGGLSALPSDTRAAMLLLADLPDLTTEDLQTVAGAVETHGDRLIWRGTTESGAPGHPIVISAELFDELFEISGDTGGADVIKRYRGKTAFIPLAGDRARRDLDTPEAWDAWRALWPKD